MRAAVALLLSLFACSAAPPVAVGISSAPAEPLTPSPPKRLPRATWPAFAAARSWPEVGPPVAALGHRRDILVRVRVEPGCLEQYRALATESPMPDGARIAAFHETPAGELRGVYVLEKRRGSWSAVELDGQGAPQGTDGSLCLRCHALAPTDYLFGVTARAPEIRAPGN